MNNLAPTVLHRTVKRACKVKSIVRTMKAGDETSLTLEFLINELSLNRLIKCLISESKAMGNPIVSYDVSRKEGKFDYPVLKIIK